MRTARISLGSWESIQEQIVSGETGLLLDDAGDLAAYGAAVTMLLQDPERARQIGERVRDHFISVRSLLDYLEVIRPLVLRTSEVPAHA